MAEPLSNRKGIAFLPKQVFWLPDRSTHRAFPFRFHDQWHDAVFVPGYSGGTALDFHEIPCQLRQTDLLNR
jgi:hypothetical protein